MEFGYASRILRVNLSKKEISNENPDDLFYRKYIGGQGIITYYLLKELEPGVDPLSEGNKVIFAIGPVTGAPLAGTGRNSVGAKSPLTGGIAEAEVGGYWGVELRKAGYDAIIIEGKSEKPVYLWIRNNDVEIRDASRLWGKVTGDVDKIIKEELNDPYIRITQIGPGGENMVRYACVINEIRYVAGRTGVGAVMGSKNLKAIAVRGTNKIQYFNKDKFKELRNIFNQALYKPTKSFFLYGTGSERLEQFAASGNLPTRNFRDGKFENAIALEPKQIDEKIGLRMETCYSCPVTCKRAFKNPLKREINVDPKYGVPEYESLAALGSNCGVDDIDAVLKANELCNMYSIDTISAGGSISFAMECFEKGLLTENDTDGVTLNFGNAEAMVKMVEKICKREGFGDFLAEGVKRMSEKIGKESEKFAVHVKGQELPMHDPRLKLGLGLGYAVSPTGADHMHNIHDTGYTSEIGIRSVHHLGIYEPLPLENLGAKKAKLLAYEVNFCFLKNSLSICLFIPWDLHHVSEMMRATTGTNMNAWELMRAGERITTMARIFNLREGLTVEDDWLPPRMFEPHTTGALSDKPFDPEKLKAGREWYYHYMGWDQNGIPKDTTLEELDLGWTA